MGVGALILWRSWVRTLGPAPTLRALDMHSGKITYKGAWLLAGGASAVATACKTVAAGCSSTEDNMEAEAGFAHYLSVLSSLQKRLDSMAAVPQYGQPAPVPPAERRQREDNRLHHGKSHTCACVLRLDCFLHPHWQQVT